ncbi:hypothetical protein Cgig2_022869 [Carnegiea gigantea]|uniref:Pentatricopeptide repeat-containing protein n=1 Tax=Carnegiea gigantea TaxID=171969 RepID=A0A9Q1KNY3_9CARY|nr:hypothetical protein Cgig2_022869 [Carnegiea gigantea]
MAIQLYLSCLATSSTCMLNVDIGVGASSCFSKTRDGFKNVVTWTSLITRLSHHNMPIDALELFNQMRASGPYPNQFTFSAILTACADMMDSAHGIRMHGSINAIKLFSRIDEKGLVTWNVMIIGLVQDDNFEEGFKYFAFMTSQGILPDEASFSTATHACGGIAALNQGTLIHNLIMKSGFERNMSIASSFITMYSKGGSLMEAHRQHGHSNQVIELLENMLHQGIRPHYITFVCLLSACVHTGGVEGFAHFDSITAVHKIEISPEHYATMVDMLGRAGQLEEAIRFIASMPIKPGPSVWGALLGACRKHGYFEMPREAAEKLFQIGPTNQETI